MFGYNKDKIIFEIANYQNKTERDSDQLLNFKLFLRRGTKNTQHHGGTTAPPHDKIKHLKITIRLLNIYKRLIQFDREVSRSTI